MFTTDGAACETALEYDTVIRSSSRSDSVAIGVLCSGALCVTAGAGAVISSPAGEMVCRSLSTSVGEMIVAMNAAARPSVMHWATKRAKR